VFASSAAVYGARPDNPLPLGEDRPARPNRECRYAGDKLDCEARCLGSGVPALVLRIGAVLGPHADSRVRGAIEGYRRLVPAVTGTAEAVQFVDEDDAAEVLHLAGRSAAVGVLNVAPDDWLTASEVAAVARSRVVRLPLTLLLATSEVAFGLGLLPFGSDRAILLNGPLALDAGRAAVALGWRARRTSAEVLCAALGSPDRRLPGPWRPHGGGGC
jgi:nucleoside-diphosphate-sugar epimerase